MRVAAKMELRGRIAYMCPWCDTVLEPVQGAWARMTSDGTGSPGYLAQSVAWIDRATGEEHQCFLALCYAARE